MLFTYGRRSVSTSCSSIGANQCIPARSAPLPAPPVLILALCATLNSGSTCPPIFHAHLKEMDGYKILNPGSHKDLVFSPERFPRLKKKAPEYRTANDMVEALSMVNQHVKSQINVHKVAMENSLNSQTLITWTLQAKMLNPPDDSLIFNCISFTTVDDTASQGYGLTLRGHHSRI